MEEPTKRPRVNPVIYELMDLPPPARQQLLKNLTVIEIIFATKALPLFSKWMDKTNQWQFVFETIVMPLLPPGVEVVPVGENSRWNCLAWYFAWHKSTSIMTGQPVRDGFSLNLTLVKNAQTDISIYFTPHGFKRYSMEINMGCKVDKEHPIISFFEESLGFKRRECFLECLIHKNGSLLCVFFQFWQVFITIV